MESPLIKKRLFILNTFYALLIGFIVYVVIKYGLSLLSPFIMAFIIATILRKPSLFISKKIRLPRKAVAFFLVLLFYCAIGLIVSLAGVNIFSALSKLVSALPEIYEKQLSPYLLATFDGIEKAVSGIDPALVGVLNENFDQYSVSLGETFSNIYLSLVSMLSGIASSLPIFFIKILLMIISTFFMAIDYDILSSFVLRQLSDRSTEILVAVKQYLFNTLFVVIRSYALIISITFIELSVGLSILGIKPSIFIALFIAIFDILPVLGTGGIMIPWSIMTFFQGDHHTAAGLIILYLIITVVRNIIEPKIVGHQLGLHPVVTLMSMFVGASLLGLIGLFGFPITLSLLKHLNDSGTIKLFK